MRINNNIASLNTYNRLSANQVGTNKSLEKLSSGLRINRAGDDAAGLAISEKMRAQIKGLNQAQRNAQDGISLIQTAEGALSETHSILQRMRELAVQGANDTLQSGDRQAISTEMSQLQSEIDGIAGRTQFNGSNLLDGSFGVKLNTSAGDMAVTTGTAAGIKSFDLAGAKASTTYNYSVTTTGLVELNDGAGNVQRIDVGTGVTQFTGTLNFDKLGVKITGVNIDTAATAAGTITASANSPQSIQIGANSGQTLAITLNSMTTTGLGINTAASVDVSSSTNASTSINNIEAAITRVSTERANLGAYQNRLEHTINNLATSSENLTASESRIRDVDMAKEMMEFTKSNILSQAATAMLAQANQQPQGILQLLR